MSEVALKVGESISEKVLSEAQKSSVTTGESEFSKLLTERMDRQNEMTQQILQAFGMAPQQELQVQAVSAEGLTIQPADITVNQEVRSHGKVLDLLTEANRGALQMDNIIDVMTSGRRFSPPELLAVQAGMHQVMLQTELAIKLPEQLANAIKTLNTTPFGG